MKYAESRIARYVLAVALTGAAWAIQSTIPRYFGDTRIYPLVIATAISAIAGGSGPGFLSLILANVGLANGRFGVDLGFPHLAVFDLLTAGMVVLIGHSWSVRIRLQESRRNERDLAKTISSERERLRGIISSLPGVVWETRGLADGASARIEFMSDYVETLTGYPPQRWLADPEFWRTVCHPDDLEEATRNAAEQWRRGGVATRTFRWITRDGRVIWVESRSAVINDNQGQPIGFRGVITDVTARKRAEDSLRFLSDASQVLASSLDFEATLRSIVELTVQSFADGCALDLAEGDDTLRRVAHSQREIRAGSEAPHRFNASLEARGRSLGMMTFTRWSTDGFDGFDREIARLLARRAAVAIDNANLYRDAVEASHARDEFLATLSHELRTPMTVTLGWVRMLLRGDLDEPTRASALEAIERSTRAQSAIIDDILDVSRIVMGKLRLDVGEIDLRSVVEAAVETIQPATEAKSIRLECSTEGWNGTVRGDAARLQQVVWNLLSNAIKFGRKDGLILLRLLRAPAAAVISISDDGAGIDPKVLPHIFERFRQGESGSTRSFEGLGLGLAIVKHVVEMHGGSVRAHSEGIGQGATFTVELPLVKPAATQPAGTGADAPVLT